MARLCDFESQVILCLLEDCSPSMCDMSQQLSLNWSFTGSQLPGIHGSSADSALLWQSIPCPSLAVMFSKRNFFSDKKFVVYIKLQMSPIAAWDLVKGYFNR